MGERHPRHGRRSRGPSPHHGHALDGFAKSHRSIRRVRVGLGVGAGLVDHARLAVMAFGDSWCVGRDLSVVRMARQCPQPLRMDEGLDGWSVRRDTLTRNPPPATLKGLPLNVKRILNTGFTMSPQLPKTFAQNLEHDPFSFCLGLDVCHLHGMGTRSHSWQNDRRPNW